VIVGAGEGSGGYTQPVIARIVEQAFKLGDLVGGPLTHADTRQSSSSDEQRRAISGVLCIPELADRSRYSTVD
jgi:hypothetical protein